MKRLLPLLLAAFLIGCNEVKDLGHYWDDATPDTMLIGQWRGDDGYICEFEPSNRDLLLREIAPTNATSKVIASLYFHTNEVTVRSITIKGYTFLLFKRPAGDGALCRYLVSSNQLVFSQLRDSVVEQGIRANLVPGEIPERFSYNSEKASVPNPLTVGQSCQISLLDEKTMEFLTSKENAVYWDSLRSFTKQ